VRDHPRSATHAGGSGRGQAVVASASARSTSSLISDSVNV
jgi:hypothetical protein